MMVYLKEQFGKTRQKVKCLNLRAVKKDQTHDFGRSLDSELW